MKWTNFSGDYYQIGYQLGRWWGAEIKRLKRSTAGRKFLASEHGCYEEQLKQSWSEKYILLLRNVLLHFPELIDEISGMAQGVKNAGFETSFLDMFVLTLGETVLPRQHCTSILVKTKRGFILGHNEEENAPFPLCFAKVHLKTSTKNIQFISVSYPFDLLGSSAGLNKYFAFQGNSIGCKDQYQKLYQTWDRRIPKTVFSRKMLEYSSLEEIINLYAEYHTTLPNHQFICFAKEAYSLEIRPQVRRVDPWQQFICKRISEDLVLQTNHLYKRRKIDRAWQWMDGNQESKARMYNLEQELARNNHKSKAAVMESLTRLRLSGYKYTLASLVFELQKGTSSVSAKSYFGGNGRNLDTAILRNF